MRRFWCVCCSLLSHWLVLLVQVFGSNVRVGKADLRLQVRMRLGLVVHVRVLGEYFAAVGSDARIVERAASLALNALIRSVLVGSRLVSGRLVRRGGPIHGLMVVLEVVG